MLVTNNLEINHILKRLNDHNRHKVLSKLTDLSLKPPILKRLKCQLNQTILSSVTSN